MYIIYKNKKILLGQEQTPGEHHIQFLNSH